LTRVDQLCYYSNMSEFDDLLAHIQKKLKELDEAAGEDKKKRQLAIAERIKFYRGANHFTQEDLAKKLFVTKMAIIRWEKGEVMPSESNLARFKELGIMEKE